MVDDFNATDRPALDPKHLADLESSGLNSETIKAAGLYSVCGGNRISEILGNYLDHKTAGRMGSCLAFPYFDALGVPMEYTNGKGESHPFIRLKPDKPRKDTSEKKRTRKYESPLGGTSRIYIPSGTRSALQDASIPLLITEGEKKTLCADQNGLPCIGLAGVWCFAVKRNDVDIRGKKIGPRELIPDLDSILWAGRTVTIAFDSDASTKIEVQWACWHLSELLREQGATILIAAIPSEPDDGKNGIDDFIVRRGLESFKKIISAAAPPERPEIDDPRPKIIIGTDEYRVNVDAIVALSSEPNLFQRGGMLARIMKTNEPNPRAIVVRAAGSPVVRDITPPLLRERMTRAARWVSIRGSGEKKEESPAHPPEWCVSAVHGRGHWPGIRKLEAIINHPVMLHDGTVLTANGYDSRSGLHVSIPPELRLRVPSNPNRAEVVAAVRTIDDAIDDFPFEKPAHRSAWYAGLLTPLAWFGFEGPAPMCLIDGNTRGVGKGLLADVIALTLTGRRFPVMSYSSEKEELRKKITSLAMEGERLVLLDNLAGAVGNSVLDMALTADHWKDRLLGVNKIYDGPLHVSWYATGNNVQLEADTARRCSHCRLETDQERPELRADVRYPNLRLHVRQQRAQLLSAALTILIGWHSAGRPKQKLQPWGSFEPWSDIVREAVVFAGMPDPGETRIELQSSADRDAQTMAAMINALLLLDPHRVGKTTAEIIEAIRKPPDPIPSWHSDLKSAVEELCGRLDGRVLGYRFRHFARRNFGGRMIDRAGEAHGGVTRWAVRSASNEAVVTSVAVVPTVLALGGDGGDGGDVPAQAGNLEIGSEGEI